MSCGPRRYCNVSGEVIKCLKMRLEASGVSIPPGESGTISAFGCTGKFNWDAASEILTILITDKPETSTCEEIFYVTDEAVEMCGGVKC
jgi:hypothetical protein